MLLSLALVLASSTEEPERVKAAREAHEAALIERAAELQLAWPPHDVYLRGFKKEKQLEVWVANARGPYVLFETYTICGETGTLGPKVEQGDLQIPEGFYVITKFIPWGLGHMTLKVNYPNDADRARTQKRAIAEKRKVDPGGGIEIHGTCISIGCLAMDNEPIEKIYLIALGPRSKDRTIHLHVFPGRYDEDVVDALFAETSDAHTIALWRSMIPAYFAFEETRRVPITWHAGKGVYGVASR